MNPFVLCPQTLLGAGPLDLIAAAEAAGFDMVSLRARPAMPNDPTPDMARDPALLAQVKAALAGSSVRLLDIEAVRVTPDYNPEDSLPHLDICRELGARYLVVGAPDTDKARRLDNFRGLAALADDYDVTLMVEFAPYMGLNSLQSVVDLMDQVGSPRLAVLTDPLHLTRSGDRAASHLSLAPSLFPYADFCDAPAAFPGADALMAEARGNRLYPGEGGLPLRDFLDSLPPGLPLRIEVPRPDVDGLSYAESASRAIDATRRWFANN